MLQRRTVLTLCEILKRLSTDLIRLETEKSIASENEKYEPYAIWQRINRLVLPHINASTISDFLIENNCMRTPEESQIYIDCFDREEYLERLDYQDFAHSIIPQLDNNQRSLVTQRQTYKVDENERLDEILEKQITDIIDFTIHIKQKLSQDFILLFKDSNFTIEKIFNMIDLDNENEINFDNLGLFLLNHGFDFTEDQLLAILKLLDKEQKGYVDFLDFQKFFDRKGFIKTDKKLFKKKKFLKNKAGTIKKNYIQSNIQIVDETINPQNILNNQQIENNNQNMTLNKSHTPQKLTNRSKSKTPRKQESPLKPIILYSQQDHKKPQKQKQHSPKEKNIQQLLNNYFISSKKYSNHQYYSNSTSSQENIANNINNKSDIALNNNNNVDNSAYDYYQNLKQKYHSPERNLNYTKKNQEKYQKQNLSLYYPSTVNSSKYNNNISNIQSLQLISPKKQQQTELNDVYMRSISPGRNLAVSPLNQQRSNQYNNSSTQNISQKCLQSKHKNEITELQNILHVLALGDQKVELYKQNLVQQEDFNLIELFKYFDQKSVNSVNINTFIKKFKAFGIDCSEDAILLLFKRFDTNQNKKLTFGEFAHIFLPFQGNQKHVQRVLSDDQKHFQTIPGRVSELFSKETKEICKNLMQRIVDNEGNFEELKLILFQQRHYNIKKVFTQILDENNDGYMEINDLYKFLKQYFSKKEVKVLYNRFDKNQFGKVTYKQFNSVLQPTIFENRIV